MTVTPGRTRFWRPAPPGPSFGPENGPHDLLPARVRHPQATSTAPRAEVTARQLSVPAIAARVPPEDSVSADGTAPGVGVTTVPAGWDSSPGTQATPAGGLLLQAFTTTRAESQTPPNTARCARVACTIVPAALPARRSPARDRAVPWQSRQSAVEHGGDGISCRRDARSASMEQAHAGAATRSKSR